MHAESHVPICSVILPTACTCVCVLSDLPPFLVSVGTWVTFGGQITDEVRADGLCDLPSVKVKQMEPSV